MCRWEDGFTVVVLVSTALGTDAFNVTLPRCSLQPGRPQTCDCCKGRKEEECNWCHSTGALLRVWAVGARAVCRFAPFGHYPLPASALPAVTPCQQPRQRTVTRCHSLHPLTYLIWPSPMAVLTRCMCVAWTPSTHPAWQCSPSQSTPTHSKPRPAVYFATLLRTNLCTPPRPLPPGPVGYLMVGSQVFPSTPTHTNNCPVCKGKGYIKCERCRGTGFRANWLPSDSDLLP